MGDAAVVLRLQRQAGNRAVAEMLSPSPVQRDPVEPKTAKPINPKTAKKPTNADLQNQISKLDLRTRALEGYKAATTQDSQWHGKFSGKLLSWNQVILRVTGGLDKAQSGFKTAQVYQAEFDALVLQLSLAAVTITFAAEFEPALTAQLMKSKIGATIEEIEHIVEKVENPAVAAVSAIPNVAGAAPKPSSEPPPGPVSASSPVSYLAENLGTLLTYEAEIDKAFSERAKALAELPDEALANIDIKPQGVKYEDLFDKLNNIAPGIDGMKSPSEVAKILERHLWAVWLQRTYQPGPLGPFGTVSPDNFKGFGTHTEDRLNDLGISKLAGVELTGHWYSSNSSGWANNLLRWAKGYKESIRK